MVGHTRRVAVGGRVPTAGRDGMPVCGVAGWKPPKPPGAGIWCYIPGRSGSDGRRGNPEEGPDSCGQDAG